MREITRFPVRGEAKDYKTYALSLPRETHYRKATCQEVECEAYANGWKTVVDVSTALGQRQAKYILEKGGRRFVEVTGLATSHLREFMFYPEQQCFADHQISLERDPIFVVRGGDWRGNPRRELRTHTKAEFWIEDFAEHQQNIADAIGQG